ncbi:hypothetical protein [Rhizomonospora bruguierae]|uniref:hypothetical protein n=1 Tax=Rhizomonospora bruguierae TaxID=1581705 RepID=UPI001BD0CFB9|nr:hypothetical protein [Micromonospora sp. NBRC 107566]
MFARQIQLSGRTAEFSLPFPRTTGYSRTDIYIGLGKGGIGANAEAMITCRHGA